MDTEANVSIIILSVIKKLHKKVDPNNKTPVVNTLH